MSKNTTTNNTLSHREVLDILHGHGLRQYDMSDRLRRIEIDGYTAMVDCIAGTYNVLAAGRIVFADNGDDNDAMAYLANLVF